MAFERELRRGRSGVVAQPVVHTAAAVRVRMVDTLRDRFTDVGRGGLLPLVSWTSQRWSTNGPLVATP